MVNISLENSWCLLLLNPLSMFNMIKHPQAVQQQQTICWHFLKVGKKDFRYTFIFTMSVMLTITESCWRCYCLISIASPAILHNCYKQLCGVEPSLVSLRVWVSCKKVSKQLPNVGAPGLKRGEVVKLRHTRAGHQPLNITSQSWI